MKPANRKPPASPAADPPSGEAPGRRNIILHEDVPGFARARRDWMIFFAFCALYTLLRLTAFASISEPVTAPDSGVFTQIANLSIFSNKFYTGLKPFFLCLLYKLVGAHLPTAVAMQALLGIAARIFLAYALFRSAKTPAGGLISAALILASGCTRQAAHWDNVALSESVSNSLAFSLLATLILAAPQLTTAFQSPGRGLLGLLAGSVALIAAFTWIRDSNVYSIYLLLPLLLAVTAYHWKKASALKKPLAAATAAILLAIVLQGIVFRGRYR